MAQVKLNFNLDLEPGSAWLTVTAAQAARALRLDTIYELQGVQA